MKARVNEECIGCGLCEGICSDVFRLTDSGQAEAFGEVTEDLRDAVQEAIDSCPVAAIRWLDE
ncbi:MAG: ferredoxin [Oscillospiraceae bacterium]|nr:ferredoxin [Oscillospiraceae bacterium]